ncbi:MAG: sigma 54-interacting transcriptional regulator [Myxococcota bacterium]|nr:sigma 54-interacting transcriptional regulator [Myxococcota bacterium]
MKHPPSHALSRWLRQVGAFQVLDGLGDALDDTAVFIVDADQEVLFWSSGAERLLGWTPDQVIGQHCLKANRCQQCVRTCGVREYSRVNDMPLTLYREDGAPVRVRKSARAFQGADGAFLGAIEVLQPDRSLAPSETPALSDPGEDFHGLRSADPAMRQVFQVVRNVAETDATILVRGESGTGKELIAQAIHQESNRQDRPFFSVNCAALGGNLLESELFGYVEGAFPGAKRPREGLLKRADGGVLFLDEVAELPLELQAKLLDLIEQRRYVPLGGSDPVEVDLRIIAATHTSLRQAVRAGRFREDLMYRLRVVPLFLPPLRDRRADIELLLWEFISRHNERGPRRIVEVQPEAMRALLDHHWPGNVRELQNVVQYAFAVGRGPQLRLAELPPEFREEEGGSTAPPLDEGARIRWALAQSNGHVGKAADLLNMSRPTFWRRRKKLGI